MRRWLSLTLVLFAGCYADHGLAGRADAGPLDAPGPALPDSAPFFDAGAIDAGVCRALPSLVGGLSCPSHVEVGARVTVELQHGSGTCCGEDAARLSAERTGERTITLRPSWDACGCCEECACVGPSVRQPIEVGPLSEGIWTVIGDAARGVTCTIVVGPLECVNHPAVRVIVPDASPTDEPLPVLLRGPGLSCGCTPRGRYYTGREGGTHVGLERCDCSDEDPCVDPDYEATALIPVPPFVGPFTASSDIGPITSQIVASSTCIPGPRVIAVEPLGIDPDVIHDAPIHVFADVTYEEAFCCAAPIPLARAIPSDDGAVRAFDLLDCVTVDCLCDPGPPRRVQGIVHLGVFPPGRSTVRLGEVELSIDVP